MGDKRRYDTPFIGTERAQKLVKREIMPEKVGDLCCLAYIPMVEKWLANPSWTTWSRIRREVKNGMWKRVYLDSRKETWDTLFDSEEAQNQTEAAAEVFYDFYVSYYEKVKFKENGGVLDKEN
jgi:hypothetical protein